MALVCVSVSRIAVEPTGSPRHRASERPVANGPHSTTVYFTIVARNYLPQALTLLESVREHASNVDFKLMIVDGGPGDEPAAVRSERLEVLSLDALGLPANDTAELATIYDVVELSTGVKPRLMEVLLRDYERAVYLDPDTYLLRPLDALHRAMDQHDIVLTPHILHPIRPGSSFISEGSSLTVGIYNLGFCAVTRGGIEFVRWWWSHLRHECLKYPLLGLFVDQKWVDMGAVLFDAHAFRDHGYNIGHWNLHERNFEADVDGTLRVVSTSDPVALMHFSGFDPHNPQGISVRQNESLEGKGLDFPALHPLNEAYATRLLANRALAGTRPSYGFDAATDGKRLTARIRRTYRSAVLAGDSALPSPFAPEHAAAFAKWRRRSWLQQARNAATDASLAFKYAFPDTFGRVKRTAPALFSKSRAALLRGSAVRR
jgi:hypothetical protein